MKKLLIVLLFLTGCVKYQVVQKLDDNLYHMYNPKKGIEIVRTPNKLKTGKFYRLNQIDIIKPENSYYENN